MIKSSHLVLRFQRGSTYSWTRVVRDAVTCARVDLTGAKIFVSVRPDMKAAPIVLLCTTLSPVPDGYRVGVVLADQTGDHMGEFTPTFTPDDTAALQAFGDDDPYFYDITVVMPTGEHFTETLTSKLSLYGESAQLPAGV